MKELFKKKSTENSVRTASILDFNQDPLHPSLFQLRLWQSRTQSPSPSLPRGSRIVRISYPAPVTGRWSYVMDECTWDAGAPFLGGYILCSTTKNARLFYYNLKNPHFQWDRRAVMFPLQSASNLWGGGHVIMWTSETMK